MAGYENIKDYGFDKRTADERRELATIAGKASGKSRQRKADFRKTLNLLLTAEIDSPEWTDTLKALGLEPTLENAINMVMVRAALGGNPKAYELIAKYSGQTAMSNEDVRNREADTELKMARRQAVTGENETDDSIKEMEAYFEQQKERGSGPHVE